MPPNLQTSCVLTFAFSGTGTIQVAHRLDRDAGHLRQNPTISLEVLVKDRPSGGQENRMQITFIVEDINDNPATCTRSTFRYSRAVSPLLCGPPLFGLSDGNRRIMSIWVSAVGARFSFLDPFPSLHFLSSSLFPFRTFVLLQKIYV